MQNNIDRFWLILVAMIIISAMAILKAVLELEIDLQAIWAILAAAIFGVGADTAKEVFKIKTTNGKTSPPTPPA
jgi:predicted membrane protein